MPKPKKPAVAVTQGSYEELFKIYYSNEEINGINGQTGFLTPVERKKTQEQINLDLNRRLPCAIKDATEQTKDFNTTWRDLVVLPQDLTETVYVQGDLIAASLMRPKIQTAYNLDLLPTPFDDQKHLRAFELRTLDHNDKPMGISIIWHPEKPEELFSITIGRNMTDPDLTKREIIVITPENIHQILAQEANPETHQENERTRTTDMAAIQSSLLQFCQDDSRVKSLLKVIFAGKKGIDFDLLNLLHDSHQLIPNPNQIALSSEAILTFAETFAPIQRKINSIKETIGDDQDTKTRLMATQDTIQDLLQTMLTLSEGNLDSKLSRICDNLCKRRINTFIPPNIDPLDHLNTDDLISRITTDEDSEGYKKAINELFNLLTDIGRRESKLRAKDPQSPTPLLLSCMQLLFVLNKHQMDCSAVQEKIRGFMQEIQGLERPLDFLNEYQHSLREQALGYINSLLADDKTPEAAKKDLHQISDTLAKIKQKAAETSQQRATANTNSPDFNFGSNPTSTTAEIFTHRQQTYRPGPRH